MAEFPISLPPDVETELVASVLEQCCLDEGLTITQKGSLAKYPGCTHWHFKRCSEPGTLEVTLWPANRSAWFGVRANRRAEWMDVMIKRIKDSIQAKLEAQSAFSSSFCGTVQKWIDQYHDLFVVVRYHAMAGAREYFWFSNYDAFANVLSNCPPMSNIVVFRDNQIALRGTVDSKLFEQAVELIGENTEWMIADTVEPPNSALYVWTGDTHQELIEQLNDMVGQLISIGPYAKWHERDNEAMISALVPLPDGSIGRGVY
jgi:hypothetical protein